MGTLRALDFAGENAVVGGGVPVPGGAPLRTRYRDATLTVESDIAELLRLRTEDWHLLVQSGVMGQDVMLGVQSGLAQRENDNLAAIAEARSEAVSGRAHEDNRTGTARRR